VKSIGIRQFRDRLTRHLRDVEKGVTIFLTSRGKPIAVLRRVTPQDLTTADPEASLETLASEGKVRRGKGKIGMRPPLVSRRGTPLSRIVSENRR
jgi:antitoxin (DNA-binding transcriptional repressor) of toxin-antitoxin stability system